VIYVSTDQVYDGAKSHNDEIIDAPNPVNVYGRTKLSFERALLANDMRRGGGGAILRCSLILGPTAPLGGAHTTFLQFIEGRLNDGIRTDYYVDEYRSCIHVDDVIRAIVHFMDDDGRNHEDDDNHRRIDMTDDEDAGGGTIGVYNLGGRTRASRHDMAMAVASRLGLDASFVNAISRPKPSGGEVGVVAGGTAGVPSPPDISMNIERITNVLRGGVRGGGRGMMDLEEIVAATFPITTLEEEGGWE
jgi:dTDP-4-dehydrorhamnose reductase